MRFVWLHLMIEHCPPKSKRPPPKRRRVQLHPTSNRQAQDLSTTCHQRSLSLASMQFQMFHPWSLTFRASRHLLDHIPSTMAMLVMEVLFSLAFPVQTIHRQHRLSLQVACLNIHSLIHRSLCILIQTASKLCHLRDLASPSSPTTI